MKLPEFQKAPEPTEQKVAENFAKKRFGARIEPPHSTFAFSICCARQHGCCISSFMTSPSDMTKSFSPTEAISLPDETLLQIFRDLEQPEILQVRAVCTQWHAVAASSPNFYITLRFDDDATSQQATDAMLDIFCRRIQSAIARLIPLHLDISLEGPTDFAYRSFDEWKARTYGPNATTRNESIRGWVERLFPPSGPLSLSWCS